MIGREGAICGHLGRFSKAAATEAGQETSTAFSDAPATGHGDGPPEVDSATIRSLQTPDAAKLPSESAQSAELTL